MSFCHLYIHPNLLFGYTFKIYFLKATLPNSNSSNYGSAVCFLVHHCCRIEFFSPLFLVCQVAMISVQFSLYSCWWRIVIKLCRKCSFSLFMKRKICMIKIWNDHRNDKMDKAWIAHLMQSLLKAYDFANVLILLQQSHSSHHNQFLNS